jgi:hypothetical protein
MVPNTGSRPQIWGVGHQMLCRIGMKGSKMPASKCACKQDANREHGMNGRIEHSEHNLLQYGFGLRSPAGLVVDGTSSATETGQRVRIWSAALIAGLVRMRAPVMTASSRSSV